MFYGKNNMEVFNKIADHEIHWPKEMVPHLKELIQKLTQPEPSKRTGLKNVGYLKCHKFFNGVDFVDIKNQNMNNPELQFMSRKIEDHIRKQNQPKEPEFVPQTKQNTNQANISST